MKISEANIKIWSALGTRATFGLSMLEFVKQYPNLLVVTADVSTSAGLDRFKKKFPEKLIDVGIAEQNMIGVATGLASEGFNVLTTTFSPFQTLRCLEQIKVNLGYMKTKVIMVGLASGLVLGNLGFTHCSIEDVGVLRSIPNIKIICPSDSLETIKSLEALLEGNGPGYIRLTGSSNNKIVNRSDYNFEVGKSITLKEGSDVVIMANGVILAECLEAAKELDNIGISTKVLNFHTIKPIDAESIIESRDFKLIVTVEEHSIIGGLGSAVAEVLAKEKKKNKQIFIGINDCYEKGGSYNYLLEKYGINKEKIINQIRQNL
jgi:transketolase